MPAERIAMRQVRAVLRLNAAGVPGPPVLRLYAKALIATHLQNLVDDLLESIAVRRGARERDRPPGRRRIVHCPATLKRLADSRLSWPLPTELTDAALEAQLFTAAGKKQGHRRRDEPDWAAVHRELKLSTSRCRSYGTKTSSVIPRGIGIRGSASCTGSGPRASRSRCGRPMPAAISCLSITLATRCR